MGLLWLLSSMLCRDMWKFTTVFNIPHYLFAEFCQFALSDPYQYKFVCYFPRWENAVLSWYVFGQWFLYLWRNSTNLREASNLMAKLFLHFCCHCCNVVATGLSVSKPNAPPSVISKHFSPQSALTKAVLVPEPTLEHLLQAVKKS